MPIKGLEDAVHFLECLEYDCGGLYRSVERLHEKIVWLKNNLDRLTAFRDSLREELYLSPQAVEAASKAYGAVVCKKKTK